MFNSSEPLISSPDLALINSYKSPADQTRDFSRLAPDSASPYGESFTRTPQSTRILIVDDDSWIRDVLERVLLRHQYQVHTASSAEDAIEMLRFFSFDLLVCDMMMTGMSGLDLIPIVTRQAPGLPIILITAHSDTGLMRSALRAGAVDFIPKPFNVETIPLIIERNLERRAINDKLVDDYREAVMFSNVQVLAAAIDAKEPFTAQHSRRVARLAVAVAEKLDLPETERQFVDWAAQVHDVGKIGIPDHILMKPGQLSEEEWKTIRLHPIKGAEIVGRVEQLNYVAEIVRAHHERIDGRGYPDELAGEEIPLLARIISVADSFEVMTANRVYRTKLSHEEANRRLLDGVDIQFDAAVVDAFMHLPDDVLF